MPPQPRWRLRLVVPFLLVGLLYIATSSYRLESLEIEVPRAAKAEEENSHASSHHTAIGPTAVSSSRETVSQTCTELVVHANFTKYGSAKLCYDSSLCAGRIIVHVPQCTKYKRQLSRNNTHHQWILENGADTFRLRIDGPETHATMSQVESVADLSTCRYQVQIAALTRPGTYDVGLEWLYSDYHALDEITNQWPYLKKAPVLPLDESFSTNYHLQQCTLPSTLKLECLSGASERDQSISPRCNGSESDSSGRWVSRPNEPKVFTRVRVKKIQRNPIVFQWALQEDVSRQWMPNACEMLRVSHHGLLAGLKGKRVVVGGDSQLRALYFGLVNFLAGYGNECLRNVSTLSAEPQHCVANVKGSHRKIINEVQIDFVDDLFLDRLGDRYRSYDVVIVGFAQHPASKEHWTFDKYRSAFSAKIPKLEQLRLQQDRSSGTTVIWYLAPQYPHTRQGYPVVVKDWRTDPRLLMFNEFAKAECISRHIPFVDAFRISTAMSHTSPDQAHFTNFVSYELVTMVANVICSNNGITCGA